MWRTATAAGGMVAAGATVMLAGYFCSSVQIFV